MEFQMRDRDTHKMETVFLADRPVQLKLPPTEGFDDRFIQIRLLDDGGLQLQGVPGSFVIEPQVSNTIIVRMID